MANLASILICTRNRLPQLRETLKSVAQLRIPEGMNAELVLVDNGSTDGTPAWIRDASLPNMPVRTVQEPRPGTGYARTTALYAAYGDILVFTDDDVRLPEDWLDVLTAPIRTGRADVVGGTSFLDESLRRPWMTVFHRASLSSMEDAEPGEAPGPLTISVALARSVLKQVPAFDPELGPGSRCGFLEDTLFLWQLGLSGCRIERTFSVPVLHKPSEDRLSRRAFLASARARGYSRSYLRYHWEHWDAWQFTNRTRAWQIWRAPRVVLAIRWLRLRAWRLRHLRQTRKKEGIAYEEFTLVNLYYQMRQYLDDRGKPRNYELRGLIKQAGVLPDIPMAEGATDGRYQAVPEREA